jgi:hypothetical protein
MKITHQNLIKLGFQESEPNDYSLHLKELGINVYGDNNVDVCVVGNWISTNASTMEDIEHLIRLFK